MTENIVKSQENMALRKRLLEMCSLCIILLAIVFFVESFHTARPLGQFLTSPTFNYVTNSLLLCCTLWLYGQFEETRIIIPKRALRISVGVFIVLLPLALLVIRPNNLFSLSNEKETAYNMILVALVPFAEEVYFRGALLDHLWRNTSAITAVILTSLLFGLMHAVQGTFISMFILSLVLCGITIRTRSILWAVLIHALWNLLSIYW